MPAKTTKKAAESRKVGAGTGNRGKGRLKGVPNKATANARAAIGLFVDNNSEKLQGWLDQIAAEEGPKAAFMCFKDLIEYHVPKLGRQEITGLDGKELAAPQFIVQPIAPAPRDE